MARSPLAQFAFALGCAVAIVEVASLSRTSVASADDAKPPAAASTATGPVTGPGCHIKGSYPTPKGTQLFDAASGGRVIGSFTGAFVPMTLSDLPADPALGRSRLATSMGSGAVRLDGWASASSLAVFTARDLPVVAGRVWIASAHKVKLVQASLGQLTGEITVAGSNNQSVRATAPCDGFTLQAGQPVAQPVPGNGRGYTSKGASMELYDDANGSVVFTLKMMEGTSQLFWSTESKAGFVHILGRGDLVIDAWAKQRDLEPLKKGELMDQYQPGSRVVTGATLALSGDGAPKLVTATKDIPLRIKRDDKDKAVGVVESGAEIYLIETITGWTNILPKSLGLAPPEDGGFWIPSSEAPK